MIWPSRFSIYLGDGHKALYVKCMTAWDWDHFRMADGFHIKQSVLRSRDLWYWCARNYELVEEESPWTTIDLDTPKLRQIAAFEGPALHHGRISKEPCRCAMADRTILDITVHIAPEKNWIDLILHETSLAHQAYIMKESARAHVTNKIFLAPNAFDQAMFVQLLLNICKATQLFQDHLKIKKKYYYCKSLADSCNDKLSHILIRTRKGNIFPGLCCV